MASLALDQLRSKALELSESERAELAHDLLRSLDGKPDAEALDQWDVKILRRLQQIDEGAVDAVDRTELKRRMRRQFAPN